jgi:Ca2+/Na+ antiporter
VISALSQKRSNLAVGNIMGSSISNILGAFALGLLFYPGNATFDNSSKMYAAVLLGITTLVVVLLAFYDTVKNMIGPFLITLFVIYVISIGYGIYRGVMSAPEDSDSDSDSSSDSDSDSDDSDAESETTLNERPGVSHQYQKVKSKRLSIETAKRDSIVELGELEVKSLTSGASTPQKKPNTPLKRPNKRPKSLTYHIIRLLLGFIALSVSCYVLSHSISTVGDELGLSNNVIGITVLSLATTLPEKFIAVIGGAKGEGGIVVANTAGSNIFLLTLCAGVLFTGGNKEEMIKGFHFAELAVMWLSAAVLCACVFFGANKKVGVVLICSYLVFLIAELLIFSS